MKIGMLWFDNGAAPMTEKVKNAFSYYKKKYGKAPTACHTNPAHVQGDVIVEGVQIKPNRAIRPNHFWIGEEENYAKTND